MPPCIHNIHGHHPCQTCSLEKQLAECVKSHQKQNTLMSKFEDVFCDTHLDKLPKLCPACDLQQLKTLLEILSWDLSSPEIMLEEGGDICLDWADLYVKPKGFVNVSISINQNGGVSWAAIYPSAHGNNVEELKEYLELLKRAGDV